MCIRDRLRAYLFRRSDHGVNVEYGPRLLAYTEVADQRLPRCVASRAAQWLLGREVGQTEEESTWLDELGIRFAQSGYQYRALLLDIIFDPRYRRVR